MEVLDDVKPLSKKLRETIPPLKDGEVATFRLVKAFVKENSREEPSCPEVVLLSGVQQVNDPFEENGKKTKKIGSFIKEYKQLGKSNQTKPIYQGVEFIRGELKVGSDNLALYEYLMRMKQNGSNKFRKLMGAKKDPEFFLVGDKESISTIHLSDLRFQAEKMVRESQLEALKGIASKLNDSPDNRLKVKSYNPGILVDPQGIKNEIIQLATKYPKQIISASSDDKSKIKVQVYDAMMFGIMFFEKNTYWLIYEKDILEVFSPESDLDSVDSLVNYFNSAKGKDIYIKFAKALKDALKV